MRPAYGEVPASELTVDHLIAPIREMLANGRLGNAANCYTLTKQFSSWCWRHHLLSEDVMGRHRKEDIFGPNDHPAEHDRVLTNAEMTAFFSLLPPPGRRDESDLTVKLLLLTGLRISELVNLPRDYFDPQAATLTIPAELQKRRGKLGLANTPPHVVPLGPRGLAVAKRLAAISQGHERLVCSSEGLELARQSVRKAVDFDCRALGMAHFTLHDLRRTYRSRLAELGVDYFLSEHLICHTLPPAQRVYQRGDMVELGREANVLLENSIAPYVWPASRVERPGPGPKASKNLPTWAVPQAAAV
jgi:integrase